MGSRNPGFFSIPKSWSFFKCIWRPFDNIFGIRKVNKNRLYKLLHLHHEDNDYFAFGVINNSLTHIIIIDSLHD